MSEKTMISIEKATAENLKKIKIHHRETYDDILKRLLKLHDETKKE